MDSSSVFMFMARISCKNHFVLSPHKSLQDYLIFFRQHNFGKGETIRIIFLKRIIFLIFFLTFTGASAQWHTQESWIETFVVHKFIFVVYMFIPLCVAQRIEITHTRGIYSYYVK